MTTSAGDGKGEHGLVSSYEAKLQSLAAEARDSVGRCHSAEVIVVEAGEITGRGCTDPVAHELERAQSEAGEGPCIDALRFLQVFNVACIADLQEWPAFREAAARNGIKSSLAVPLSEGERAVGTLNLYSRVANGFEDCEQLAMDFASRAAPALARAEAQERL